MRFLTLFFVLVAVLSCGISKAANFNPEQMQEIQKIVHDYLVTNPQVLIEASEKLQQQTEAKEKASVLANIQKYYKDLFVTNLPGRATLGNPNGSVVIAEFLNYQCGHCKATEEVIANFVKTNPDLKIIVIPWPIFGKESLYTAKAALAAQKQGKFLELHNALFASKEFLNIENTDKIVKTTGLNVKRLQKDMQNNALDNDMRDNFKLAQNLGLQGTPAFIIANKEQTKFSVVLGQTKDFPSDLSHAISAVK
jgi:protein-disulfide isomerase